MFDYEIDRDEKVINLRMSIEACKFMLRQATENLPKLEAELAKRILWLRQRG